MAKKKPTHHQISSTDQSHTHPSKTAAMPDEETHQNAETTPAAVVEDQGEKLANLRSLNARLLKQTVENRQEIGGLLETNKSLETELTRSESEVARVKGELARLGEVKDGLEREMKEVVNERDEITRAKCERESEIEALRMLEVELRDEVRRVREGLIDANGEADELRREVARRDEEGMKLRGKLIEVEGKERRTVDELGVLRVEFNSMSKRLEVSERNAEGFRRECEGLRKGIEELDAVKEVAVKENEGLRKAKGESERRIKQLDEEVTGLNALVLSLREGEEKWRVSFSELEASNCEVVKELEGLRSEVAALLEEKKAKEIEIERLIGQKKRNLVRLSELEKEIEGLKRVHEEGSEESSKLEEVTLRQESEISKLQGEVNEIRGGMALLQEANVDQLEKNMSLLSEINEYKSELDRVKVVRDDVMRTLDEEKSNQMRLQVKVSEISKRMEETEKVTEELRSASDTLAVEKKELENKYNSLVAKKSLVEKNFVEAKEKVVELEGSLGLKSEIFEYALATLRNTALHLQVAVENEKKVDDEGITVNERSVNGDLEPYLAEIDAIKAVFKSRDEKVGEMQQQMASLQCSVLDAKKKKSFWTLVSSATTIVAAIVSFAYAAKVR